MADAVPAAPAAAPAAAPVAASNKTSADPAKAPSGEQTHTDPAKVSAPVPASEKFLIKVNGKLKEVTKDELIRKAQMGDASRETWEKSSARTKKIQTLLNAVNDPDPQRQDEALKALGVDPDKIAERRLALRAQQSQMTPEQRRIAELEAQIENDQKTSAQREAERQAELAAAKDREEWAKLESSYMAEIDRATKAGELGGMKPAEALYHMADAAEMNIEFQLGLTPTELLAEAKAKVAEQREQLKTQVMALEGPALLEFLGTDAVNRVIRAARTKYQGGQPIQQLEKPAPIAPPAPEKRTFVAPPKAPWL